MTAVHVEGGGTPRGTLLRFSRRLSWMHALGLSVLLVAVSGAIAWQSSEHTSLARSDARRLVAAGIAGIELKLRTFVRDYSVWNEAYDAARDRDVEWIYANLATAVTELDSIDLLVLTDPEGKLDLGWLIDTAPEGTSGVLPEDLRNTLLNILPDDVVGNDGARSVYAVYDGAVWLFAVARVVPFGDLTDVVLNDADVRQIHGLKVTDAMLEQVGDTILMEGLSLSQQPPEGLDTLPLLGGDGTPLGYVTWTPPAPGERILMKIAGPLVFMLLAVIGVGVITSVFAVRAARRLERALVSARAADQSKTEFLANVSHELRTPMNGILGVAELLSDTRLDDEQREMVSMISDASTEHMGLLEELLDFSKLEAGGRDLRSVVFEPAALMRRLSDRARIMADERPLDLVVHVDERAATAVIGDDGAIQQILDNLVQNAFKFTTEGEIGIRLDCTVVRDEMRCRFAVSDTGPGIASEDQDRIFDRFVQVDSSLTRSAGGAGLGLAISKALATLMGAELRVESAQGEGSTFILELRLELAPADTIRPADAA